MPVVERVNPTNLPDITKHPFAVTCAVTGCYYSVAAKSNEEGVALLRVHACPYIGGPTTLGWTVTLTTLEKCWIKLDAVMVELMEGHYPPIPTDESEDADFRENPERTRLKGVCRGMAEVLAEFMGPHFRTADEIAGEAKRRYDAKKAGEDYETAGLGQLRYQPPPGDNKYAPKAPATQSRNPAPSPVHKFTEDEVGSIKFAHESGMFTIDQLAKTYKVKVDVIQKVLAG